jgi:hypothetical protein
VALRGLLDQFVFGGILQSIAANRNWTRFGYVASAELGYEPVVFAVRFLLATMRPSNRARLPVAPPECAFQGKELTGTRYNG